MTQGTRTRLPASTGLAIPLDAGQLLRVTDPDGRQVADLVAFARNDPEEWLSSGRTLDEACTLRLTTGHVLLSNRSRPMLRLEEDTVGRHDFLFAACSREMFARQYGVPDHASCTDALGDVLAPHGISRDRLPTPFNIFMNVHVDGESGALEVRDPLSVAGSHLDLRAEMDLLVAVSACSAERTNAGVLGPIDVTVT